MEDNSYVNLSLEKYNELYDKAKKFDELSEKFADKISKSIDTIIDNFNKMFTSNEEETEQKEVEDIEFKVGDKVKLVRLNDCTCGLNLGDICTITNLTVTGVNDIEIDNGITKGYVNKEDIKKIKEEK